MSHNQFHDDFTQDDQWTVISQYFKQNGLVSQQLESYDKFIESVQDIVLQEGKFTIKVSPQFRIGEDEDNQDFEDKYYRFEAIEVFTNRVKYVMHQGQNITPMKARLRDLTYMKPYYFKLKQTLYKLNGTKEEILDEKIYKQYIDLCSIPVMVRSKECCLSHMEEANRVEDGECDLDQGGYFIVRGSEKVIVAQERMAFNFIYLFKGKTPEKPWHIEIRSTPEAGKGNQKKLEICLIKKPEFGFVIMVEFAPVRTKIPLFTLMRALGIKSDKKILECIFHDLGNPELQEQLVDTLEMLKPSVKQGQETISQEDCLFWIGNKMDMRDKSEELTKKNCINKAIYGLQNYLLPHIGTTDYQNSNKAYFLGYMVQRLLDAHMGKSGEDDRDHYGKKRVDMAGALLTQLFREKFRKIIKEASNMIRRDINENKFDSEQSEKRKKKKMQDYFNHDKLTRQLANSLATGNWGVTATGEIAKFGVSQVLKRDTSLFSTMSHLRRLNAPIKASTKIAKPRQLHNTHFGMICPAETPEGAKIGIVKNLALMAHISLGQDEYENNQIKNILLESCQMEKFDHEVEIKTIPYKTKVFFNGNWIGFTDNPHSFVQACILSRRENEEEDTIPIQVSIVRDIVNKEIKIYSDQGRCMRPLFIIDKETGKPKITPRDLWEYDENGQKRLKSFSTLVGQGYIEFLDVEEEEGSFIAVDLNHLQNKQMKYTHLEIHPAMILGVCASVIPFGHHNQGPRNTLQSAMGKQAMSLNSTNFITRLDSLMHILYYPQVPLASSKSLEFIAAKDLPIGSNSVVGIACFTGYNQEDSILFNQSSIDRGFMRSMFYRTYRTEETNDPRDSSRERICEPDIRTTSIFDNADYGKLDKDGIITPETVVKGDIVLVGKVMEFEDDQQGDNVTTIKNKDCSLKARRTEFGNIDTVMISKNQDDQKFVKIRIRSKRVPQIGDKFASRHGQKGTVGMTFRQEDLPYNIEGIIPDIIINPHCIPSRMTIGHMIEQLCSKVASLKGIEGDATPFSNISMHDIAKNLHEEGYQKHGNEVLYSPFNGIRLDNQIFFGPTFYQRLRHLVDDKMYSRHRGPVESLTRQPTHGRSHHGGLRFGEMERDCIISHGTSRFLKERTFEVSDIYRVHVCSSCGLMAKADLDRQEFSCKGCDSDPEKRKKNYKIVQVYLPYASKLLIQELMAMHIIPRLLVDVNKNTRNRKFI